MILEITNAKSKRKNQMMLVVALHDLFDVPKNET